MALIGTKANQIPLNQHLGSAAYGDIGEVVQQKLVSGTNIKTVGGTTLLGSGDIAAGSLMYLGQANASGAADVTFDSLSGYDMYFIIIPTVYGSISTADFRITTQTGGSAWSTGYNVEAGYITGTTTANVSNGAIAYITTNINLSTTAANGAGGTVLVDGKGTNTSVLFDMTGDNVWLSRGRGSNNTSGVCTGIRFGASAGTLSGDFYLYGIKDS